MCQEISSVAHRGGGIAVKKVFVGGISQDTRDEHLREYFSRYGIVQTASVMTDKLTGNSRGFGFVVFESADAVDQLCSMLLVCCHISLLPYVILVDRKSFGSCYARKSAS